MKYFCSLIFIIAFNITPTQASSVSADSFNDTEPLNLYSLILLKAHQCSQADSPEDLPRWDKWDLTWSFHGESPIDSATQQYALEHAFGIWAGATSFSFTQMPDNTDSDIQISWEDLGKILHGISDFPPSEEDPAPVRIRLHSQRQWTIEERMDEYEPIDLVTLAAHEIGHALGMNHNLSGDSLMAPVYQGSHRFIAWWDAEYYLWLYHEGSHPPIQLKH